MLGISASTFDQTDVGLRTAAVVISIPSLPDFEVQSQKYGVNYDLATGQFIPRLLEMYTSVPPNESLVPDSF